MTYIVVGIIIGLVIGGAIALGLASWALNRFWNSF
jgi:hypothetical protein